jgi:hypothetical protein
MSRNSLVSGAILVVLAGTLGSAHAQLYQWRDTNGKMVFSDTPPPPGIPAGNIIKSPKGRAAPPAAPAPAAAGGEGAAAPAKGGAAAPSGGQKSVADREAEFKKRQAEAAERASKEKEAADAEERRQARCRELRSGLAQIESGQRIRTINEKGEPVFMEDADRAQRGEQLRRDMAAAKC